MKRGITLIEIMIIIAIVAIVAGLAGSLYKYYTAKPEVIKVQQTGTLELQNARTVTKVPYGQIESFLSNVPADTKITQVVPVFSGHGDSFDIKHYIVITEK